METPRRVSAAALMGAMVPDHMGKLSPRSLARFVELGKLLDAKDRVQLGDSYVNPPDVLVVHDHPQPVGLNTSTEEGRRARQRQAREMKERTKTERAAALVRCYGTPESGEGDCLSRSTHLARWKEPDAKRWLEEPMCEPCAKVHEEYIATHASQMLHEIRALRPGDVERYLAVVARLAAM